MSTDVGVAQIFFILYDEKAAQWHQQLFLLGRQTSSSSEDRSLESARNMQIFASTDNSRGRVIDKSQLARDMIPIRGEPNGLHESTKNSRPALWLSLYMI